MRFTAVVFVVLIAHLTSTSFACKCLPLTLKQAYNRANSVVVGRIISVMPYNPLCSGVPCFSPVPFNPNLLVKVRRKNVLKGCGPPEKIFWIKTKSQTAACGVPLRKGEKWLLNLPLPTFVRRLGEPTRFYEINLCGRHTQFRFLTKAQKRQLRKCSKLPQNQCMMT